MSYFRSKPAAREQLGIGWIDADGNIIAPGSVKSSSATAGIGYAAGAGGQTSQSALKTNSVTINAVTGTIATDNATLNANTTAIFTVNNTTVAATDVVSICLKSGGTEGAYLVWVAAVAAGSFRLAIRNITGGNLSETVLISFVVIKGVTA